MNRILAAAFAVFLGMGVSAHAADIYEGSLKDDPVAYAPAPIWAGLYVGGHVGGLWNDKGDSEFSKSRKDCVWNWYHWKWDCGSYGPWETKDAEFETDETERSLLGGVHVGYNWQEGSRVFGLEGDVSFAKGIDYLASLRARVGHAVDNTLFYGTAGIAFAGFKDKTIDVNWHHYDNSFDIGGDKKIGLVLGGGIEHKLASNVSIGLEGLYYFFKDSDYNSGDLNGGYYYPNFGEKTYYKYKFTHEDDNDLFVVRARLNYHIQRDEPTLDSYK
jgi:outer membrane immunogenic protein